MEEVKVAESRALEVVAREPDPKLSENALRVLQKRYLKKDDKGRVIETPKELFTRVVHENLRRCDSNGQARRMHLSRQSPPDIRGSQTARAPPEQPAVGRELHSRSSVRRSGLFARACRPRQWARGDLLDRNRTRPADRGHI